ncbi:glycosyltransferase [Microvirga sp. HBU67558]|uniref:glycosyltransferase family protein n=1 Tax=Microvirga sp. HBU67558 TaxID=2824562 RepID=UPI001B368F45|nr:glycosyltransferase [Microvirga sp. HBU67558]MBQ0823533.1 glycosyltransferase [Microvirga sp. HBU67558]
MIEALKPQTLVELGTQDGFSYLAFCQAVRRLEYVTSCYSVGTWERIDITGSPREGDFALVNALNGQNYADFSHVMQGPCDEIIPRFADGSIDLLHFEGHHTYEAMQTTFGKWQKKISSRGVFLVHNINVRDDNIGAWRLWSELKTRFPSFEFTHGSGLGVIAVGTEIRAPLQSLFSLRDGDIDIIRATYSKLGRAVREEFELEKTKASLISAVTEQRRLRADISMQKRQHTAEITAQEEALQQLGTVVARIPKPVRAAIRYGAKAVWWLLTPERIRMRLTALRARVKAQALARRKKVHPTPIDMGHYSRWDQKQRTVGPQAGVELSATEIRPNKSSPIRLGILAADVQDFTLNISGWVINEKYPGLPIQLALELGNSSSPRATFFAYSRSGSLEYSLPEAALHFSISHEIPERLLGHSVRIRALDDDVIFEDLLVNWNGFSSHPKNETALSLAYAPTRTSDLIVGKVEIARTNRVSGWALNRTNPQSDVVELILTIDDVPYARTKAAHFREDIENAEGEGGFVGFEFPLAPNVLAAGSIKVSVQPSVGRPRVAQNVREIKPSGHHIASSLAPEPYLFDVHRRMRREQKISVIILNRNGADVLKDLLDSARRTGDLERFEWIIVDHHSTDDSADVCARAKSTGADIHFFDRKGNFSFSDSNNFGAKKAAGDILVFANNDLIFRHPTYERILDSFEDDRVGIIGARLLDFVEAPGWESRLPVQHVGVFAKPRTENGCLRPYESRLARETPIFPNARQSRPAVTAAFIAMRRTDFEAVGGFDETYSYGLEDVDLSFKVRSQLEKEVLCDQGLEIIHRHGYSRSKDESAAIRRRNNNHHFNRLWAQWLRRNIRRDVLSRPGYWTGARPTIGFIVKDTVGSDDFVVALELGRALQDIVPVHLRYLGEADWYNLGGIDILIVMVGEFSLTKVKTMNPYMTTVNWVQQCDGSWIENPSVHEYDHVWALSERAADFLRTHSGRKVELLPLASNINRSPDHRPLPEFDCDYCFIGNNHGGPRTIQFDLDPSSINGRGIILGANWDRTPLSAISIAPVDYTKYPSVYASSKIVIDDVQGTAKVWGSCTRGIFDAIAAGCLVVSNGVEGVRELFGDLVPTYHDRQSLTETLNYWISHEEERERRVEELRRVVNEKHTYKLRAKTAVDLLATSSDSIRVAIKCPAPSGVGRDWGDYHFAQSLAGALRRVGCVVRVDLREDWECALSDTDDAVIVLRGVKDLNPKPHQKSILWLISHPEDVPTQEINRYDHVYVASALHAEILQSQCKVPVEYMPQCTDTARFRFDPTTVRNPRDRVVFVGNSRGAFRDTVRWAIEHSLDIHIYGSGWKPFISDNRFKGRKVPNAILGEFYASSRLVLCDHWEDMRRLGYISNRVFDVLAAGGNLAVDPVEGLSDLLPKDAYKVYRNGEELASLMKNSEEVNFERRAEIAAYIAANHSFDARAETIMRKLREWHI